MQKAMGILGGTFDPIHFGHLRAGLEIYQQLHLKEIRVIPCYKPVHKHSPLTSAEDRLAMVDLAVKDEPAFVVDDREIKRQGLSYMFDTLLSLRADYPQTPLCLILGIDAFMGFPSWHRYTEILALAHLVITHRPPYPMPTTGKVYELMTAHFSQVTDSIHLSLAGNIIMVPMSALDISATAIRNQLAAGESPRYLLPDSVYKYIKEHGIYHTS